VRQSARVMGEMGLAHAAAGNPSEAADCLRKHLHGNSADAAPSAENYLRARAALADALAADGDAAGALAARAALIDAARAEGARAEECDACVGAGRLLAMLGRRAEAAAACRAALQLAQALRDPLRQVGSARAPEQVGRARAAAALGERGARARGRARRILRWGSP